MASPALGGLEREEMLKLKCSGRGSEGSGVRNHPPIPWRPHRCGVSRLFTLAWQAGLPDRSRLFRLHQPTQFNQKTLRCWWPYPPR